ncbi:hypothetical protein GCM10010954_13020 [Halobacillus andaensis]|uniref:Uncharacterized protein n=1 Tax=Halobacillus andaensis TaxID=1176239 RepID=A0A917B120_HALAA|nr:hypothetical protein GCM10010954_13020 [Halobacillus andaensis]
MGVLTVPLFCGKRADWYQVPRDKKAVRGSKKRASVPGTEVTLGAAYILIIDIGIYRLYVTKAVICRNKITGIG